MRDERACKLWSSLILLVLLFLLSTFCLDAVRVFKRIFFFLQYAFLPTDATKYTRLWNMIFFFNDRTPYSTLCSKVTTAMGNMSSCLLEHRSPKSPTYRPRLVKCPCFWSVLFKNTQEHSCCCWPELENLPWWATGTLEESTEDLWLVSLCVFSLIYEVTPGKDWLSELHIWSFWVKALGTKTFIPSHQFKSMSDPKSHILRKC